MNEIATSENYISFVLEQLEGFGAVRVRKMFGEYLVYLADKPILTVCDDTVFVKKMPQLAEILAVAECGFPYDGAKECYILDIENRTLVAEVIPILVEITSLPKPKKKKTAEE